MARVLHTSVVAPSPSPGGAALPERSLPLTYMDAMWLHTSPVERVFLFHRAHEHDDDDDAGTLLSNLQDSLSEALRSFYPLAGRLCLTPGTSNRHELHYQPGDGVSFTVAEYDHVGVGELATDEPTELARSAPLVPRLPEGGAVLALQVNLLRRGGLAVGVTVHHAACDGACSTHFLHTWAWAAASRGATIAPEPPVIGRTFIRDRDDLYDAFATPRPYRDRDGKLLRSPDAVVDKLLATFVLSEDLLRNIKGTVAGEAARRGLSPLPPPTTSTVATYGFIWHCYYRAKESRAGGGNDDRAYAVFAADHRARLDPPVPATYLGNCLGLCFATGSKKEITTAGAGGLLAACSAVAAAIDQATRPRGGDGGWGSWDACLERVVEAYGAGVPLTLAGSPRFRVYDVDFGFGRPAKVDIVSVARTGAMSVAEGRGGAGGTEVGISLPPDGMRRFRRCFADAAVACLSSTSPVELAGAGLSSEL
ncbi:phenolic glucoside malonyltransferase 1-like [Triticum aestivum]|uniref:phenolic glucoside malonyltransferase 1-like n=1 Tax=Triticum aestivum TaxID=4565 RepID=UPI001D01FFB6|nr:phenolic glucoside malonyltransferase 1-like [Triticum aestivum]